MTTAAAPLSPRPGAGRRLVAATWNVGRSPWVWTPAAVGTAGLATATVALGRMLTAPQPRRVRISWSLRVSAATSDSISMTGPAAGISGCWGLEFPGGQGVVGTTAADGQLDDAVRSFRLLTGSLPMPGTPARLMAHVWPDLESFRTETGIVGIESIVSGETGPLPAWVFPAGDGTHWAILVHGRGAPRSQMLRMVPALHARGITAMVISYRNDSATCGDPSGRMHFGHREWLDLEAAVAAASARGATKFVLGGMSMGGAIIATFLRRSTYAPAVVATVLDAPALNWGPILRHVAREWRVPQWLVPGVMTAAAWQARIDWKALNHLGSGDPLTAPVLLIHGERDPVVPVELSDAYAAAEPDLVTYLRVAGAGHVSSWNTDPAGYETALATFLDGPVAAAFARELPVPA